MNAGGHLLRPAYWRGLLRAGRQRLMSSSSVIGTAAAALPHRTRMALAFAAAAAFATTTIYFVLDGRRAKKYLAGASAKRMTGTVSADASKRKLTSREKRFIKFASVEHDGQVYMTPQDFLESVVEAEPRPRFKRKRLTAKDVEEMVRSLPKLHKNDDAFFRNLGNQGIISYSEYLFLLTILIKPQSGFKIAFAMLDRDGNERIDKKEFKVLETVFSSASKERQLEQQQQQQEEQEDGGGDVAQEDAIKKQVKEALFDDDEHGLHRAHKVDTSLLVYFFGRQGRDQLRFEDFRRFMDNLQTEVLAMEFQEFSKGAKTITEIDFARILLRYTFLNEDEYESVLERLYNRLRDDDESQGIDFASFRDFCLFLNNLEDFQIAMRMYTLADKPISEEEFARAVFVTTGRTLDPHLVHVVFQIFDQDGDGLLSYQEFVVMMRDRLNRGLKGSSRRQPGWAGFKKCVKQEMRAASTTSASH